MLPGYALSRVGSWLVRSLRSMVLVNELTGLALLAGKNEDFDASHLSDPNTVDPARGLLRKHALDALDV